MPDLLTHKSTAGSIRAENIIQSHLTDSMNEIFMGGTAARSAYARNYFLKALIFELGTARLSPYDAWVDPAFAAEVIENGLEEYYEKMNA